MEHARQATVDVLEAAGYVEVDVEEDVEENYWRSSYAVEGDETINTINLNKDGSWVVLSNTEAVDDVAEGGNATSLKAYLESLA